MKDMPEPASEQAANGGSPTWPETVDALLEPIYRFVRARAPAEVVDDLVQDTFMAAGRGIRDYRGSCALWNWLTAIARNKIAEYYRRRGAENVVTKAIDLLCANDSRTQDAFVGESSLPDELCERQEFRVLARAALSALGPEHRACLVGRYCEDLSLDELSQRLGISRAAANARLYRARAELRQAFLRLLGRRQDDQECTP
jgi:RNA polymerase sigma-70 factor, ECF subfamily